MSITIDGKDYPVPVPPTQFRVPILGKTTHPYRRDKPKGVFETDEEMQTRVQADVLKRRVRARQHERACARVRASNIIRR